MTLPAPVPLGACPPGLFLAPGGALGFRSEYGDDPPYLVASGEAYWGGATNPLDRDAILVRPVPLGRFDCTPLADVIAERTRQVEEEGWSLEHDDEHSGGEMARAAACYAAGSTFAHRPISRRADGPMGRSGSILWPWALTWWKPKDPRRNLEKAGSLILAEMERLDRAASAPAEDAPEACFACEVAFKEGDLVLLEVNTGQCIHAACCGPEREGYVNADGEPLKDGEPIPTPFAWKPDAALRKPPADGAA